MSMLYSTNFLISITYKISAKGARNISSKLNFESPELLNNNNWMKDLNTKVEEVRNLNFKNSSSHKSPTYECDQEFYLAGNNCSLKTTSKRDIKWHILQHNIKHTAGNTMIFLFTLISIYF